MDNSLDNRIKKVMASVFDISVEDIKYDAAPDTIESWDSLKHMNMIVALEEEFEVEFSNEDIIEMMNYKLILELTRTVIKKVVVH
jgi:acyl carrier protein